jgi:Lar family restriction alleviation protein
MTDQHDARDALLPCPFCGCSAVTLKSYNDDPKRHKIKCEDCPGGADFYSSTREQAIAAWNRRAATQPTKPEKQAGALSVESLKELEKYLTLQPVSYGLLARLADVRGALKGWPAAPSQSAVQPLSEAQAFAISAPIFGGGNRYPSAELKLVRAIERAHGIVTKESST